MATDPQSANIDDGNSMYHFFTTPVRVLWKIKSLTLLSINELNEHHISNVTISLDGSYRKFPSNLGMSEKEANVGGVTMFY